jgi:hypothetical protein
LVSLQSRHDVRRPAIIVDHPCRLGVCLDLGTFLRSSVQSRSTLITENLRKQLAFYQERAVRPKRLSDAARISLVLWSKFCDWRSALVIVKPETLIGWHRRGFKLFWRIEIAPGQTEATQKHPSTDCSNGRRKSNLGTGSRCRRVGSEAGHSSLTTNDWNVLAEPAGQQRPLIAALEQPRSQSHPIRC